VSIDAIAPVLSRIAAIQTRIGAPAAPPPVVSFADQLRAASSAATPAPAGQAPAIEDDAHAGHVHVDGDPAVDPYLVVSDRAFGLRTAVSGAGGAMTAGGGVPAGTPYADVYADAAARHGIPADLLAAVGWVESRYQPDAVSPAGAIGVMQLMPFVADELGVDPWNPVEAIDGAARLLAAHFDRFGSWSLALGAYHSGAGAVARAGNDLPSPRAVEYVRRVHERMEQP
jgi:soluble lytic murein transglycosylase-like protein